MKFFLITFVFFFGMAKAGPITEVPEQEMAGVYSPTHLPLSAPILGVASTWIEGLGWQYGIGPFQAADWDSWDNNPETGISYLLPREWPWINLSVPEVGPRQEFACGEGPRYTIHFASGAVFQRAPTACQEEELGLLFPPITPIPPMILEPPKEPEPVPEPETALFISMGLIILGAFGLFFRQRKR